MRLNVKDYREITAEEGDIVYADPPYKTSGEYYFGMIDFGEFFGWLRKQQGGYLLSLNGFQGGRDRTVAVPTDLFDDHHVLNNGISPFERLNGDDAPPTQDSLYIRRQRLSSVATHQLSRNRSKSAQIRNVLEDDPDLSVPEVVQRLGQVGIDVDANLVRVVRHQSQKANPWESRWWRGCIPSGRATTGYDERGSFLNVIMCE